MMIKCNLKVIMAEMDLNQGDVADKTGLTRQTIGRYMNNEVEFFSKEVLNTLCVKLDVKIDRLLIFIPDKKSA
jgi:DNA-binding Xre family transcriptional regulator